MHGEPFPTFVFKPTFQPCSVTFTSPNYASGLYAEAWFPYGAPFFMENLPAPLSYAELGPPTFTGTVAQVKCTVNETTRCSTLASFMPANVFESSESTFTTRLSGHLRVTTPGFHLFRLTSSDGGRLFVKALQLITLDKLQGPTEGMGALTLTPGFYPIRVDHWQGGGGLALTLEWRPPGVTEFVLVPASALFGPV